jgi:dynein light chain Tctex-type 1
MSSSGKKATVAVYDFPEIAPSLQNIARDSLHSVLESTTYAQEKVQQWMDTINSNCMDSLKGISPNFKFISSCVIMQKIGTGLHYDSAAHWDAKTDGCVTFKFENESLVAILSIFALAI